MHHKSNIKIALANANESLKLGLAVDIIDFLGNTLQEEFDDQVLIYMTQRDSKVDDLICKPLQGEEFTFGDPFRPTLPDDTHPNCRCFWVDKETHEILGQDGFFATTEFGSADGGKDTLNGQEGVWRTVKGTKVFFPDGEDPKDVIDKAFKNKPKTPKKKLQRTTAPQEELKQVEKFDGHRDPNTNEWIQDKEPKPIERSVDVQGMQVDIPEGEDEVSIIDDFRDKNDLWVEVDQKDIESLKRTETHPLGRRIEIEMEKNMRVDYPSGSVYLTTNGEWVGGKNHYGYDEDHRPQIREGLTRAGIKLTGKNEQGDFTGSSSMILGLEATGMIRAGARGDLSLDIYKPLTSEQRNSIQDYIISEGIDFNDIHIDTNDTGIKEDTILRSIGAFGSLTISETVIADGEKSTVDGKEGVWRTVKGTKVFFPDGEDPKDVIDKAFKNKPKTPKKPTVEEKPKQHKSIFEHEDPLEHGLDPDMTVEELSSSSERNSNNFKEHTKRIQESVKFSEIDYSATGMSESEVKQGITETLDPHSIAYSENPEFLHTEEELKQMWNDLGEDNQDLRDRFVELERGTVRGNEETRQLFEKSDSFYRGTDLQELDDMLDDGVMGNSKFEFEDPDDNTTHKFDFTAVTPHRKISNHYNNGVTIEFEGDSVRKHGTPVTYDMFWRDFGAKSESIDGGMHTKYMDHNEVRMPRQIPLEDMKIKNIYLEEWAIDSSTDIDKYSKLGNVIVVND